MKPVHLTPVEYKILIFWWQTGKGLTNSYIQHKSGNDNTGDYRERLGYSGECQEKDRGTRPDIPGSSRTEIGVGYRFG